MIAEAPEIRREAAPSTPKISLEARANTPEKQEELKELEQLAKNVEEKLHAARLELSSPIEMMERLERIRPELIEIAKRASNLAQHYGNFNVGGVMVALKDISNTLTPEGNKNMNPWSVTFNANTKPLKTDGKWCAEQYLMDSLEEANSKIKQVISFVVVGIPRMDDVSLKEGATLTPCKICRDRMVAMSEKSESQISPETEVVTADLRDTSYQKFQRVKDLHRFHGEGNAYIELD